METAQAVFRRYRTTFPSGEDGGLGHANQFHRHAVGVGESQSAFAEEGKGIRLHAFLLETLSPVVQAVLVNRIGGGGDLVVPGAHLGHVAPGKEGQNGARTSLLVTVVQMVCAGIVEVHCFLDQAFAQGLGVETPVTHGIACNGGDVMDASDLVHGVVLGLGLILSLKVT